METKDGMECHYKFGRAISPLRIAVRSLRILCSGSKNIVAQSMRVGLNAAGTRHFADATIREQDDHFEAWGYRFDSRERSCATFAAI
jgi:hypothetical protein